MAVVTPLNWNLTKADLDGKCLILGDSQATISSIRFTSQLPLIADEFSRTIMGHHIPGKAMNSVGNQVTSYTVTGVTHTELTPGDAWSSGGDTTVHWNESRDIASNTNLANFTDLLDCMADESDFDAFDLSGPLCFRAAFHNHADSQLRVSLKEKRGTTEGNNANYGNGGSGTNYAGDVDWDETGDIVICHKGIRGTTAMSGGSTRSVSSSRHRAATRQTSNSGIWAGCSTRLAARTPHPISRCRVRARCSHGSRDRDGPHTTSSTTSQPQRSTR